MNRVRLACAAVLVTVWPLVLSPWVQAQQNGEARSSVPTVVRTDYDMRAFSAPLSLSETESRGRGLFAQRCANCHAGTAQNPGPPLSRQTIERLGEPGIREKMRKGSTAMPGFEYALQLAQIDQIVAFLKTAAPAPARSQASSAPPE